MDFSIDVPQTKKLSREEVDLITERMYTRSIGHINKKRQLYENIKDFEDPQCTFQPNALKKIRQQHKKSASRSDYSLITAAPRFTELGSPEKDHSRSYFQESQKERTRSKPKLKPDHEIRKQISQFSAVGPYDVYLKEAKELAFIREQDFMRRFPQHYPQKERRIAAQMELLSASFRHRHY